MFYDTSILINVGSSGVSPPPVPTIALRSFSSLTYATRVGSTVPAPSSIVNGDILIAVMFAAFGAPLDPDTITPPAGFVEFGVATAVVDNNLFGNVLIYWKRANNESGNYGFDQTENLSTEIYMGSYSGCKAAGTPLNATMNNIGTGANSVGLSIDTTKVNSWLLYFGQNWGDGSPSAPSAPAAMVEDFSGVILYAAHKLELIAGATGDVLQANHNTGSNPWSTRMVELLAA